MTRLTLCWPFALAAASAWSASCAADAPAAPSAVRSLDRRAAIDTAVGEASRRFGVPTAWIWAVMRVESGANALALSSAGAIGLMQVMPATYADLRQRHGLGADPYDVRDNILAGVAYLRELHDRYGTYGMLAAYNAGPGRWEDHLQTGRPLPNETRAYLVRLATTIGPGAASAPMPPAAPLPTPFASSLFVGRASTVTPLVDPGRRGGSARSLRPSGLSDATETIHAPAPGDRSVSALVRPGGLFVAASSQAVRR